MTIGINPDNIVVGGRTINEAALELIRYCKHHGIEDAIIKAVIDDRPDHPNDGFLKALSTPTAGTLCALDIQCRFAVLNAANPHRQIRIRMGLHTGEVISQGIEYSGDTVNVAARIVPLAKGGQIVVSETVKSLCGDKLALSFKDHGRHTLMGVR